MTETDPISKSEYEALARFRHVLRQFLHFSEQSARSVGLTPQQHQALLAIRGFSGRDEITVGELAECLLIQHHSAVGLVDRLENQSLVHRGHHEGDKRQVYIGLTPQGKSVLEALSAVHRTELGQLEPQLAELLSQIVPKNEEL